MEFVRVLSLRACASAACPPPRLWPCSLLHPSDIVRALIRLARLVPVTPPAFPTSQLEKMGAGIASDAFGLFDASRRVQTS